ncbi:MAG: AAC(3) family N-acetyltransferase [Verrucomicrobia bacterium]|nr:AAC(3) family N-acetyltransferase [Verrucomicrobiota bacterium]
MIVTKQILMRDLKRLGVKAGDAVLAHSALSAIGQVRGGANTVIDALLESLGPKGTLLMPALSGNVFDIKKSPTWVGLIPEVFRRRKGVLRSFHPTHSVTAFGARATELIADHLKCPTPCGEGTPYVKLMDIGGKILLLGVDQDRSTSLHSLESLARAPYLSTITRQYRDPADGKTKSVTLRDYPGPHRDFIQLDRLFREAGIMKIGKVGQAVSRLIDAAGMREVGLRALRENPAACLCGNPNCADCVGQRAAIKRHRLSQEDFQLSAVSDCAGHGIEEIIATIEHEGIQHLELRKVNGREFAAFTDQEARAIAARLRARGIRVTALTATLPNADWNRLIDLAALIRAPAVVLPFDACNPEFIRRARRRRVQLRLENFRENSAACAEQLKAIGQKQVSCAFNAAHFAAVAQHPFLGIYMKSPLKRFVTQFYVNDGTFAGEPTLPGQGNAEIKELISILRCASFNGLMTLKPARTLHSFATHAEAFWKLLDTM